MKVLSLNIYKNFKNVLRSPTIIIHDMLNNKNFLNAELLLFSKFFIETHAEEVDASVLSVLSWFVHTILNN